MGLRIAVLSRNFATTGGGAERYSIAVVEQLAARHEIHVFAQTIAHQFPGVTYHHVPMPMERPRWMNQLYFAWKTWRLTRTGFDVVHSHENTWHGAVQTVHVRPIRFNLLEKHRGFMQVFGWLNIFSSPRLIAYVALEAARYKRNGARFIVSASQPLQDLMVQCYPKAQAVMRVIAPGVERVSGPASAEQRRSARQAMGLRLEGTFLLFVGNDFKKKGLTALLHALARLPTHISLAVVGQSHQQADIQKVAAALGVQDRISFLGAVTDMASAYIAANILVHPTLEDSYAMVVLEAMSHGLPVVVSSKEFCGIAAELEHGKNAWILSDPRNVEVLLTALDSLTQQPDVAGTMALAGVEFARGQTWERVAGQYEALYVSAKVKPEN
jgi:UDP-glucose:(heptosyl)LPS alpha-1,3-glucosyltransferase